MTIMIIIAAIILLPFIIALFVKKDYAIERHITINKPIGEVFNYIKLLKNQDNYSVWNTMDPNMKKEYSGVDGTAGFTASWDSNHKSVGKGSQTIKSVTDGQGIEMRLHFIKPFDGLADAYLKTTVKTAGSTNVAWGFSSSMKYPMNIMLLVMNMEKMLGKDLETGLNNMKNDIEQK